MISNDQGTPRKASIASMLAVILSARHDPVARIMNVDLLSVLVAALLPWSTSAVADRFQNHVVPFFCKNLCFSKSCQ